MKFCRILVSAFVLNAVFAGAAHAARGIVLEFNEQETGTGVYPTRTLVTPEYMRIDDGEGSTDFVLLDRKARTIYSTNAMDRRILVIRWRERNDVMPAALDNTVMPVRLALPSVSGFAIQRYRLSTAGTQCYEVDAAPGLLPEALVAMKEMARVLAVEHGESLEHLPQDVYPVCDVVSNVYAPTRHLDMGFPVRTTDHNGRMRQLTNYHIDVELKAELFVLPAGYTEFTPRSMRGPEQTR
jgi:hypothetical protein